jgi:signal transduction histidine kinase
MPTRYTLPGGRIALSVSLGEGVLQANVIGIGIRIAPEDQDRFLGRFYCADHPLVQQGRDGAGLGLALANEALLPIGDLLSLGHILSDCGYQFIWVKGFEEEGHPSSL